MLYDDGLPVIYRTGGVSCVGSRPLTPPSSNLIFIAKRQVKTQSLNCLRDLRHLSPASPPPAIHGFDWWRNDLLLGPLVSVRCTPFVPLRRVDTTFAVLVRLSGRRGADVAPGSLRPFAHPSFCTTIITPSRPQRLPHHSACRNKHGVWVWKLALASLCKRATNHNVTA